MPDIIENILIALIPSLIVAILAAYLSAQWALAKFYKQRWWEKQAETYSKILEHLAYLRFHTNEWINDIQAGITIKEEQKRRLALRCSITTKTKAGVLAPLPCLITY